ncbi:transposase [Streptomyces sp. NPDC001507]|uniref:transposase n=1 Tax=Streptomyces sp. NPDC001507 TaxID=3364579 RepID=UPI0036909D62
MGGPARRIRPRVLRGPRGEGDFLRQALTGLGAVDSREHRTFHGQGASRFGEQVLRVLVNKANGAITKAPGGGEVAGRSPVDRGKQGMKRSSMTDGYGIPLGRILAGANCHDSPLLAPTLDLLPELGPLPDKITVHLDAGYDSARSRALLGERGLCGRIARKGTKAPVQATQRWHVERTHAWQNAFHRLARCYERRISGIEAFFDLADTIITVRSLIRRAWTTHRWDTRPRHQP